ncbi:hypothetical protein CDD81_7185 [Ophiocordyceps australis]|uniref:Uncharacterized protein n=1 Tax=Ophiocordyceps australis TaxID=1399860 RepID=A0A2C5X947_9HYPO|nr:hypothetical protein CDD81_7185 [Ophiocordyceps australis]
MPANLFKKLKRSISGPRQQPTTDSPDFFFGSLEPAIVAIGSVELKTGHEIKEHLTVKHLSEDYRVPTMTHGAVMEFISQNLYQAPDMTEPDNIAVTTQCHVILGFLYAAKVLQSLGTILLTMKDTNPAAARLVCRVFADCGFLVRRAYSQANNVVDSQTRVNFLWPIWSDLETKWQAFYAPMVIGRVSTMHQS